MLHFVRKVFYSISTNRKLSQAKYTFDQLLPCTCFDDLIQKIFYVLPIVSIFGSIGDIVCFYKNLIIYSVNTR